MDDDTPSGQFHTKLVQRWFAITDHPLAQPVVMARKLAATDMSLTTRRKRTGIPFEDHQIIDEAWRYTKMTGSFPVSMSFLNIRYHTLTQRHRM
jgi:hypothetical protein